MTTIIFGLDTVEVFPSNDRPNKGMLETITFSDAHRDNPGITDENARRLSGLAADLILRDYDNHINQTN